MWAFDEPEREEILSNLSGKRVNVQRYKGLGEMSATQLWDTTMDPKSRTLLQVSQRNTYESEGVFSLLMGEVVEPRRNFIQAHALEVQNLDV